MRARSARKVLAFFSPNSSPPFPILARIGLASSAPRLARPLGSRVTKQINASTHTFRDAHTHRAFRRPPPFRSRRERAIRFSRSRSCARGCRDLASRAVRLPFRARPLARGWAPPGERPIRDARPRAMTVFAPPIPRDDATERDTRIANPRFARAPSGRTIRFASRGAPSSSSSRSRQTPRPPPARNSHPRAPTPRSPRRKTPTSSARRRRTATTTPARKRERASSTAPSTATDPARPPARTNRARGRSARKPPIATRPTSDGASRSRSRDTGVDASTSPSGTVSPVSSSDGSPRALDASAPAWAPGSAALDIWEKPRRHLGPAALARAERDARGARTRPRTPPHSRERSLTFVRVASATRRVGRSDRNARRNGGGGRSRRGRVARGRATSSTRRNPEARGIPPRHPRVRPSGTKRRLSFGNRARRC